jgi:type I restriction enzyme S subunit
MGQSPDSNLITDYGKLLFMQGNSEFSARYPAPTKYCDFPEKCSRANDILLSVRAPVGEINISDKIYCIGRGLCSIKPSSINGRFLWYYLLKSKEDFYYYSNGSTFDAITAFVLLNFPMTVPNAIEQIHIADYLDKRCSVIDKTIELQKSSIEKLQEYKKSIITEAVTKGLNPNVPMKDSGIVWIGEIPEHTSITRIGALYSSILGKMVTSDQVNPEETLENYLCALNVHFDGIDISTIKQMWFSSEEKNRYELRRNDLLIVEGGAGAGGTFVFDIDTNEKYYIQNSIHRVRPSVNVINQYLYYWLFSLISRNYIEYICNKATIPHFTKEKLLSTPMVVFSFKDQQAIVAYLDKKCSAIDKAITEKQGLIEKLIEYKKSLVCEAVTGKMEIKGVVS